MNLVKHEIDGVETDVTFRNIEKEEYWEERLEVYQAYQTSREIFDQMSDIEREVIASRVRVMLEALHDNVEGWLPTAFTLNDGDCVNVTFKILKTKIDADISDRERVTSYRLNEAAKDMQQMILELDYETLDSDPL